MSKELTTSSANLTKSLEEVNKRKAEIDAIGNQCLQISVVDDTTLSIAQQNLSKANQMAQFVEAKLTEIKAPYWAACKQIDKMKKEIPDILSKGIDHIKLQVKSWEMARLEEARLKQEEINRQLAEESAKIQAENKRKQDIKDYISNHAIPVLKKMYDGCVSIEKCDNALSNIETKFKPREYFEEFADEAYEIRDNYIELIKSKKDQLLKSNDLSDTERELFKQREELALQKAKLAEREAEVKAQEEKNRLELEERERLDAAQEESDKLANELLLSKTKNIRFTWKFELVDKSKLTQEWITLDESAVRAFMKEKKDSLQEGECNGVRFYKEMSVIS